ncbi:hypothetical protein SAMN05444678_1301, partial [Sphingomonas sp. YR710]|uniref:hypothetical protein n=1 Tax=Sphingomonas sp. YR710 TaxID=1882773 RepID=UPI00088450A0
LLTSPENAEAAIPDPGAEVAKKPKRRRKMTRMQRSIRKLNKQTADNRRLKEWRENLEQRARAPKKAED